MAAAATAEAAIEVRLFSQSAFHPPADSPQLVASCPTLDLSAAVGGGNAVYVRRRGGEIVSRLAERGKQVQALSWKANGQYLAVAWSDGVVRLAGLESTKAVHQIRLSGANPSAITFISWARNLVGCPQAWSDRILDGMDEQTGKQLLDLPRALMFLEVEDDLPMLPPLPVSGGTGDDMFVFSTRTSLELMFPPLKPSDGDSIHVMVLSTADGVIHISIYDTFVMGTFKVPMPPSSGPVGGSADALLQLRRHASHPASSTHVLLLANEEHDSCAVYLAPVDLSFIYSYPLNLSLLAYKTATFQKLFRYIQQTQAHMQGEWQSARELPARFLSSIQEDLEKEPRYRRIDHALRAAALTGYVSPTMKEWLVDIIAERGHKRWDKAAVSGLANLRDLLHENMMPALDRATLALSRLRGLAEFHSNDDIGFSARQIEELMDKVSCLILASHNALALVTAELDLFLSYSGWFRALIDRLALPREAEEQAEKEPIRDVTPVIDYISNHLLSSPLDLHFGKVSEVEWDADWKVLESEEGGRQDSTLLNRLEEELELVDSLGVEPDFLAVVENAATDGSSRKAGKRPERGTGLGSTVDNDGGAHKEDGGSNENKTSSPMKAFPTFAFLMKLFSSNAERVLKDIAESEWRHVYFGQLTRLDVGAPVKKYQMAVQAMIKEDQEESPDALVYTAIVSEQDLRKLHVFCSSICTSNGVTKSVSTQASSIVVAGDGVITDYQFLGTGHLLVLWTWTAKGLPPRLIAVPVQPPRLSYVDYDAAGGDARNRNVPALSVDHDPSQTGTSSDGLCWVADLRLPAEAGGTGASAVRIEVLGPKSHGDSGGSGSDADTHTSYGSGDMPTRVCVMYSGGSLYTVYVLPTLQEMFQGTEKRKSA